MDTSMTPRIVSLTSCSDPRAGGKAVHLAKLAGAGLRVPDGFVIIGATPDVLPEGVDEAYARLGVPVAVRSSAMGEDAVDTSFAGQYDTFLGVNGAADVKNAIVRCLQSVKAARTDAYRDAVHARGDASMSVVVQRMVDARAAGVLFTRNPVNGAEDEIVVEAARGLGEGLVSGHVSAHRLVLSREATVVTNDTQASDALLDADVAARLVRDALVAEKHFGHPLDMEWAIDGDGTIHWLQARPITTTNLPGMDELDSVVENPESMILCTYNVGEILPGAATPLSTSLTGGCLDESMRAMYSAFGIPRDRLEKCPLIVNFCGHLFLHLNAMYLVPLYVAGTSKEGLDYSLAGRILDPVDLGQPASQLTRLRNAANYFRHLLRARREFEACLARTASFEIERSPDIRVLFDNIGNAVPIVTDALGAHLHTSSLSGALQDVLLGILSGGVPANAEHQATFSGLMAFVDPTDPDSATSSLGLAQALDRLVSTIAEYPQDAEKITRSSEDEALAFIRSRECSEKVRASFEEFLEHHGHRCIREVELHQADWKEDPRPLIANVQGMLAASQSALKGRVRERMKLPSMPFPKRLIMEKIVSASREALVLRERSKSHAVRILRKIRPVYLELAQRLVDRKDLPDTDLIFYFTHEEVGKFIDQPDPALVRRALHRRRLQPQKMALQFPPVCKGKPKPIEETFDPNDTTEVMQGTPVSRGVVIGSARVARSPEEAKAIEPGEILVVPYTDVGWAPYFLRAAGLASEIGGTLSHGAVVARECGLPAIVNLPGATKRFRTGDKLRLDGNNGELRLISRAGSP